ncbi:MAG: hypothetical protein QF830_02615 [Rhodospirillales bacterium]|jgi:hypothetical protein|nr:hypothetical protein [Rhodospirillales bacterium]MDP6883005.1 hypothetical protein [Rhodospirillales bacterium]
MKILFVLGWVLLGGAFVAAAYETMARIHGAEMSVILSAHDLWYTLWPGKLVVTQILVERHLHWALWEYLARPLLSLPAWLLLGGPGAALAWRFRPRHPEGEDDENDEDESLFLFDALAEAAEEEDDYDRREDDMAPDHGPFDDIDLDGGDDRRS